MTGAVQGHADARFDTVAEALADELTKGNEVGAAIAIDIDGELAVDIRGGHADAAKTVAFWGGWGGSMVLTNPARRMTATYVMNRMGQGTLGNERTARYAKLIYKALS